MKGQHEFIIYKRLDYASQRRTSTRSAEHVKSSYNKWIKECLPIIRYSKMYPYKLQYSCMFSPGELEMCFFLSMLTMSIFPTTKSATQSVWENLIMLRTEHFICLKIFPQKTSQTSDPTYLSNPCTAFSIWVIFYPWLQQIRGVLFTLKTNEFLKIPRHITKLTK